MSKKVRKRRGDRYDATRVKMPNDLGALFPYLMKGRNDSIAYFPFTIDVENLLDYMEKHKGTDKEITIFQTVLLALLKVLRERPNLNRYIIGRRMYQRKNVVFSFIARRKMEEDSDETNVLVTIKPEDDRATVMAKLSGEIKVAKKGEVKDDEKLMALFTKLPRSLLRLAIRMLEWYDFYFDTPGFLRAVDPLRCSIYFANLGSVGLGAPYHHLFEWGTCSLFVCIGKIQPSVVVGEDGQPAVRKTMELRIALDERIADGYYDARALELLEKYIGDPSLLEDL
ncbi:MAG: 2-oxo acid dehydrogenase subunit E2 [Propionibacteriaceae bacterium]|nr:2-oxo acid dehydrogenase subunit E2 [Propionibacteriaceae bacterium]